MINYIFYEQNDIKYFLLNFNIKINLINVLLKYFFK